MLAALALLAGCGGDVAATVVLRGATMGTTYTVKYVGPDDPEEVHAAVRAVLDGVDRLFSLYDPASEISRFNAHRSTEPFAASADFGALVRRALRVAEATGGAFDPTVLPVVVAQGFGPERRADPPSAATLDAALACVGWDELQVLDGDRLRKRIPALALDLNAMAPGWGVDRIVQSLAARGIRCAMVEIGGEVFCAGERAPGIRWRIGIEAPAALGGAALLDEVELRDAAIATSGVSRNVIEVDARKRHHIVDPRTGRNPDHGVVSVSVRATDCALADALATALMVLGPGGAEAVFARFPAQQPAALFVVDEGGAELRPIEVDWRQAGS